MSPETLDIFLELIKSIAILGLMLLLPGWAFLAIRGFWRHWEPLERWILAACISIAFYPILYYLARALTPAFHFDRMILWLLLGLFLLVIVVSLRKDIVAQVELDRYEWAGVLLFVVTLLTRFYILWNHPYPAETDSLHHTLLTQQTAHTGQLPCTSLPFEPANLDMYHLGLYALSGTLQSLTGVAPHTVLLVTAQFLNAMCGLGIYLAVNRIAGKKGALIGMLTVGLLSFQPSWYFNWGRFTQLGAQTILPAAWIVNWRTLVKTHDEDAVSNSQRTLMLIAGAILTAGVFLLHFRVAGYFLPLLLLTVILALVTKRNTGNTGAALQKIVVLGVVTLILISPAIARAIPAYIADRGQPPMQQVMTPTSPYDTYYEYPPDAWVSLGAKPLLLALGVIGALGALYFYPAAAMVLLGWFLLLFLEGHAYKFGIPLLAFTNFTAILILLYIPLGLLVGIAVGGAIQLGRQKNRNADILLFALLLAGIAYGVPQRAADVDASRYFVTRGDVAAMSWIKENTPPTSRFGFSTLFWQGRVPTAIDAGYWIPYYAERQTTAGTMLIGQTSPEHVRKIQSDSVLLYNLANGEGTAADLRAAGINYIYIGKTAKGRVGALDPDALKAMDGLKLIYNTSGISIFQVLP